MRIAKPLLLVSTPLAVMGGLCECNPLAGGLVFLMAALLVMIGWTVGLVVRTIRSERAVESVGDPSSRSTRDPRRQQQDSGVGA
jgi:p-aminobenzoyl-glutamate transporter AbgT